MIRTGKEDTQGQTFYRRLLSEYNTEFTLDSYVSYFELKDIVRDIDKIRKAMIRKKEQKKDGSTESPETSVMKESIMESMAKEREALYNKFFKEIHASYIKVRNYLAKLEAGIQKRFEDLHKLTEADIRERPEDFLPALYSDLQSIIRYRSLNLAAFRQIFSKFLQRCACDSLEVQKRLFEADQTISQSSVAIPSLDLRGIALDTIVIYGTVYRLAYEEAVEKLDRYQWQRGTYTQRIIPNNDTFYYTFSFPHLEKQGNFALRVLAGSTSLFCEKMITEVLQVERFPSPCCRYFSDGEVDVVLQKPVRGDDVFILQSMVASENMKLTNSSALVELALMIHTAKLASAARISAVIPFLGYTNNVASIAAIAEIIEAMGCDHVITVDMFSQQVEGMFSIPMESISAKYELVQYVAKQLTNEGNDFSNITVVAPVGELLGRAKDFADTLMRFQKLDSATQFVAVCTAVKPLKTRVTDTLCRANSRANLPTDSSPFSITPEAPRRAPSCSPNSPGSPLSHDDTDASNCVSRSIRGMEMALRRHECGREAVITHHIEESCDDYENIVLVGDVRHRLCIIVDVFIDEAVNIAQVARQLKSKGATRIILVVTHAVFSGKGKERIMNAPIDLVVTSDSINQDDALRDPRMAKKLRIIPIAPLLAEAIEKIHTENTLPSLFEK